MILLVKLLYMRGIVAPFLISTNDMVADIFTKALPSSKFFKFRDYVMNIAHAPGIPIADENGNVSTILTGKAARLWTKLLDTLPQP